MSTPASSPPVPSASTALATVIATGDGSVFVRHHPNAERTASAADVPRAWLISGLHDDELFNEPDDDAPLADLSSDSDFAIPPDVIALLFRPTATRPFAVERQPAPADDLFEGELVEDDSDTYEHKSDNDGEGNIAA